MKKVKHNSPPSFWDSVRWPLIVIGLLIGHASLMMIGVTWAIANKSAFTSVEEAKSSINPAAEHQALPLDEN